MHKNIINNGCVFGNNEKTRNLINIYLVSSLFLFVFLLLGCNKQPEYIPGQSVQGINVPIAKVLFSPLAFDGALVKVQGHVAGLLVEGDIDDEETPSGAPEIQETEPEDLTTLFKLVDTKGNYLTIILPGTWEIEDGDYLIVGGIFRKDGSEIEAQEFEIAEFDEDEREGEIERRDDW